MPTIVNFFAGPGAGKSTSAALMFVKLKTRGVKCELVTEFAKDLTWERRSLVLQNQLYVLAKQHKRIWAPLQNGVDIIVTDSPLLLGTYYGGDGFVDGKVKELAFHLHDDHPSVNFLLERTKEYQQYGRSQTEGEARVIDGAMEDILDENKVAYHKVLAGEQGIDDMLKIFDAEVGHES